MNVLMLYIGAESLATKKGKKKVLNISKCLLEHCIWYDSYD